MWWPLHCWGELPALFRQWHSHYLSLCLCLAVALAPHTDVLIPFPVTNKHWLKILVWNVIFIIWDWTTLSLCLDEDRNMFETDDTIFYIYGRKIKIFSLIKTVCMCVLYFGCIKIKILNSLCFHLHTKMHLLSLKENIVAGCSRQLCPGLSSNTS